jgi:hypothetical protein
MRSRRILLCSFLLTLFTLVCLGGASAQQTWWVQSADWGAGNQRQDVTNQVRRLVNGPNFRANTANLGDPAVGRDKTLRIVARDSGGMVRDFNYREGAMVNSMAFTGGPNSGRPGWGGNTQPGWGNNQPGNSYGLRIVSAKWGAGRQQQDVTNRLQSMVRNNRISVKVTPQTMGGDPAYGTSKTLTVIYQYQGRQSNTSVPEGAMLNLP